MLKDLPLGSPPSRDAGDITLPRGRYFGPCAGSDLPIAFEIGGAAIDHFTFCDISYSRSREGNGIDASAAGAVAEGWTRLSRVVGRDVAAAVREDAFYRPGPLRPSSALETWQRPDGSISIVELRCDRAQDALMNLFGPRSVALFVHICDGMSEGGSNLWFLADRGERNNVRREGLGLLEDLAPRLAEDAVVITDGALTDKGFRDGQPFTLCGIAWEPLGTIRHSGRGNGVASAWRVHHIAA